MLEPRTFRVFVSSTFKDLEEERNYLREHVYPGLRDLCAQHGARFQPIDLRWGVSREASLDQQAMNVCLEEIDRCREVTPRPNFIVLLGNRHGWLAPPPQIPASELEEILEHVPAGEERDLLAGADGWYRRDDNAIPSEYCLRPRSDGYADDDAWSVVERRLHSILWAAAAATPYGSDPKYGASATEQEILRGALGVGAVEGRAFCFVRELTGPYPDPGTAEPGAAILDFVDAEQGPIEGLKRQLATELPYASYDVPWDTEAQRPSTEYLERLAEDVREALTASILAEIQHPLPAGPRAADRGHIEVDPALDDDGRAHHAFAEERCAIFVGREQELAAVAAYLRDDDARPWVITGAGGTGKSALLAEAVRRAQRDHDDALLTYRFIGATAASSDARALLQGLCEELARHMRDETPVPGDYQELVADLRIRLERAGTAGRVLVFLDSLDQLSPSEGARGLAWLPSPLPAGVRMVVSTRPGDTLAPLERRDAPIAPLGPMDPGDGAELLRRWLDEAQRTLRPAQVQAVLERFASSEGNPLYLRLAFQEARRWRSDETPEALATGVEGIIATNTFGRLAHEENHGTVLVPHALAYLAASRYGLAEDELLAVLSRDPDVYEWFISGAQHIPPDLHAHAQAHLGTDDDPTVWLDRIRTGDDRSELREFLGQVLSQPNGPELPVVLWSRLAYDLRRYLTQREADGATLITFFHRELDDVARDQFLADVAPIYHERLARYFRPPPGDDGRPKWAQASVRGLSELPYHLIQAERWDDVEATLTDFDFLEAKATIVAVDTRTDEGGNPIITYNGVRRLQDDFDLALRTLSGDEAGARPRLVVTATDFGDGYVIRCPHCNVVHVFHGTCEPCHTSHDLNDWIGRDKACPNPKCNGGPLRVNQFTVGGEKPATQRAPAPPEEPGTEARPAGEPAVASVPDLPLAAGAAQFLEEGAPEGQACVNDWLLALVERNGDMAEGLVEGLDVALARRQARLLLERGMTGDPLPVDELVRRAARHARGRGVDRIAERDLAAVILTAAGHELHES